MITFSVVTITYNAADVLKPTLDSVLRQSFPTIEHIIVDGASTDNTLAIADAYKELSDSAENGHVVRIKSEPDKGLYDAMNKGLARANGDYVVFLNAGDRFPAADTIEKVALAAEVGDGERRPAVVYGDTDIVDEKGNFLYHRRLNRPKSCLGVRSAMVCWYAIKHFMPDWTLPKRFLSIHVSVIQPTLIGA